MLEVLLLAAVTTGSVPEDPAKASSSVEIVVDGSGSMLRPVGETTVWHAVGAALADVAGEAGERADPPRIALRIASGTTDPDHPCTAGQPVIEPGDLDPGHWAAVLAAVEPGGVRPIVPSVVAAIAAVADRDGSPRVVIVTSGADGCGADPATISEALAAADRPVELRVVGLDLDAEVIDGFGSIALRNAVDGSELAAALRWAILDPPAATEPEPEVSPTPTPVPVTVSAPSRVDPGRSFELSWTGPERDEDFVSLAAAGSSDDDYLDWARVSDGAPATLLAPMTPGPYELRYVDGSTGAALARAAIEVAAIEASLEAPATVRTGRRFRVAWTGPAAAGDFIAVSPPGSDADRTLDWASTSIGSPLTLAAPDRPGSYEVRYVADSGREILARAEIEVEP